MLDVSQPQEKVFIIKPNGRLDAMVIAEFEQVANDVAGNKPQGLIFDLQSTSFIDSSGLSSIIKLYKSLHQAKTPVAFCQIPDVVQSLFKLTRVNAVFKIFDTLDEATEFVAPKK